MTPLEALEALANDTTMGGWLVNVTLVVPPKDENVTLATERSLEALRTLGISSQRLIPSRIAWQQAVLPGSSRNPTYPGENQ